MFICKAFLDDAFLDLLISNLMCLLLNNNHSYISMQPHINPEDQLSYEESFKSCSASHRSTLSVLEQADSRRENIKEHMAASKLPYAELCKTLQEYL